MEYGLQRQAGVTRAFLPISPDDFEAIAEAKEGLLECLGIEEKFELVVENFLELEDSLLHAGLVNMIRGGHPKSLESHQERALFNRRLANLLTAAKTYAEQVPDQVAAVRSESRREIEEACRREYRGELGYRAMAALRNYVQHRDFPIRLVTYGSRLVQRPSRRDVAFSVDPHIRPSDLRGDARFNPRVLRELDELGEVVRLKPLIRGYMESLWRIHSVARGVTSPRIAEWEPVLHAAIERYRVGCPKEGMTLGLAAVQRADDGNPVRSVPVVEHFNDYRRFLEAKNGEMDGFAARYVTSEVSDKES
ncbi:MAG TPA: hypothetical protein VJ787_09045 [Thermoleophilia bacterium]|nr:hypothetical protein [Thermoleophilia bacterium]